MSRITKNVMNFMKISFKNRFLLNKTNSLNQLRTVSNTRHQLMANNRQIIVVSKRFAANSPRVDQELTQFLKTEIELEMKTQNKPLPTFQGWDVAHDGSNLVLTKTLGSEQITVRTNINHSVDTKDFGEEEENEEISAEMVCRPDFAVEIKKGNTVLGINCTFGSEEDMEDEPDKEDKHVMEDEFQISEFSLFEEEFKENSYAVSGDVMDGAMYELMLELLSDRGVDHSFARNLIEYTTVYEHKQYVGLLDKLKTFLSK